ncbi:MAG: hypothetical protein FWC93_06475 [Defluviitaleaceae bacterium]|nr:hypothetical protein [Defluviitaleaceae bacterium]
MIRKLLGVLLLLVLLLSACGQDQDGIINDLEGEIARQDGIITELEKELAGLRQLLENQEEEPVFQGWPASEIRRYLAENGYKNIAFDEDDIIVGPQFVMASGRAYIETTSTYAGIDVIFAYLVFSDSSAYWHVVHYIADAGVRLATDGLRAETRQEWPIGGESAIVRFVTFHDTWPEDYFSYFYEEISGANWRDEAMRLMLEHTDIDVQNLWYEGSRLVVDLTLETSIPFNWGTTGGYLRTRNLIDSFASFPGVTEIEVLVDGVAGVSADRFSFENIFMVNQ